MVNPVQDAFGYLIGTVIQIYMILVLLRFLFQLLRVNFRNPMVEPIVRLTQPPLSFLRRYVPGLFGIDLSAVVLMLALGLLKIYALNWLIGSIPELGRSLLVVSSELLNTTIWVFMIALIAQAIMSWFSSHSQHPIGAILDDITRPLLAPIRRLLPSTAGVDFSPMVALIGLSFLRKLLINPLLGMAYGVM